MSDSWRWSLTSDDAPDHRTIEVCEVERGRRWLSWRRRPSPTPFGFARALLCPHEEDTDG
jgi:hypothetical protein